MSNAVTNICRPAQMPATPKNVLMAIADRADDQGVAWPSIPGLCEATCFSRSAVIEAVKWLEVADYVSVEKTTGRNNRFMVRMERIAQAPAAVRRSAIVAAVRPLLNGQPVRQTDPSATHTRPGDGPVRETDPTRPAGVPPPVRQPDPTRPGAGPEPSITIIQPSVTTKRAKSRQREASKFMPDDMLPDWLPVDAWRAYTEMRDQMRKPMTVNALLLAIKKLNAWRQDGCDPRDVLENSVMNSHQGLYRPSPTKRPGEHSQTGDAAPAWAVRAGFSNRYEAENEGCFQHNAHAFSDGKRIEVPA